MDKEITIAAKRFKKVREEQNYTQQAFADFLELGNSTVDIERGKTKIPGKVVMSLLKNFQINPLWLFGESFQQYITIDGKDLSPKVISIKEDNTDAILLVNQKAAAGYPHNIQDVDWYQTLPVFNLPLPQFRNATYRGFQVEGDSMLPNIRPNDWVLGRSVSNIAEASDNKIYIVVLYDSVLVKKLEKVNHSAKIRLLSLNQEYLPIEVNINDVQELWQVNSKLTFGIDEPSESTLLKQLQQSMDDLKGQINRLQ
ncbi:MAG: LexA family transcriptional regulator [Flavobacteriaceae bacterium]|nr:LexA family transcriptional regulator [Flavobacteriaceae bacterium]|tara:strand:- start:1014 stop:1778 length:765 start_codon:yes stop_codon:yes gene_type:complete